MSRIGRAPITVPAGVTVTVGEENLITVKGPKGTLTHTAPAKLTVNVDGAVVTVTRPDDEADSRALHGLTRTLINNMIVGVSAGFQKKLEILRADGQDPGGSVVKNLPMQETQVQSLDQEDPLEEEMVTHSSILA